MSIEQFLQEFINSVSLRLNDTEERDDIVDHREALKELLREHIDIEDFILSGSYKRNTIIKPSKPGHKFDIDLFMIADSTSYKEENLADLYDETFKLLDDSIGEIGITHVEKQNRSVKVEFGSDFHIDVAPAVVHNSQYAVYDRDAQQPLVSNPEKHQELVTDKNAITADNSTSRFVPLVRLLKAWKRNNFSDLKSFHLELLAVNAVPDQPITSFSQGAGWFFENVLTVLADPLLDPANEENVIDQYLDEKGLRQDLNDVLEKNISLVQLAVEAEQNNEEEAIALWKKILGPKSDDPSKQASYRVGIPARPYGGKNPNQAADSGR